MYTVLHNIQYLESSMIHRLIRDLGTDTSLSINIVHIFISNMLHSMNIYCILCVFIIYSKNISKMVVDKCRVCK